MIRETKPAKECAVLEAAAMQVVKSAIAKAIIVEIKVLNFMMVLVEGGLLGSFTQFLIDGQKDSVAKVVGPYTRSVAALDVDAVSETFW